jgi:hypothetical protein
MKQFGNTHSNFRKPSDERSKQKITATKNTPPTATPMPSAEADSSWNDNPLVNNRRTLAAGSSPLSSKAGALPPLPPMNRAQINEFIKQYFPPGFPLPK